MKLKSIILFTLFCVITSFSIFAQTSSDSIVIPDLSDVFVTADTLPSFPGGHDAYMKFLNENIKYPLEAEINKEHGKVVARFVVEKDGKISRAHILKRLSPTLDAEILRVINSMPDWISGKIGNESKPVEVLLAYNFIYSDPDKVFDVVEVPPSFPGGEEALSKYISNSIQYPDSAMKKNIQGTVYVLTYIWKDGSVRDAKVIRSVDASLDKEAIRVVSSMPNWIPGKQRGIPVNVKFWIPVRFRLDDNSDGSSSNTNVTPIIKYGFGDMIPDNSKMNYPDFPGGLDSLNSFIKRI